MLTETPTEARLDAEKTFEQPGPELSDHDVAEGMRDGRFASPQVYGDFWLFDLRITGTGIAYRNAIDEWAIRDPEKWLSPEFIARCNGLAVIFQHPSESGLNHEEFRQRAIGTIVLPYRKGAEVWGIAKIFDADAALLMQTTHTSTSPGVTPPKGSTPVVLESGAKVLDEDLPLILDHLAVCEAGVWDKDGPPTGIRLDAAPPVSRETLPDSARKGTMTEEEIAALKKERDDAMAELDSMRKADAARKDAEEKERADKAKRDAEETEAQAVAAAEKEKADKEKRDARKDRHAKHDGMDIMDCSRCDSEESEEAEKSKKDAAAEKTVNADRGTDEIHDSKALRAEIDRLHSTVNALTRPLTIEDRNEIAEAFHRADSLYQMHGDSTPQHYPGESPIAYRRRLADGLRKYTTDWKEHPIHDSVAGPTFGLIEKAIFDQARASAKTGDSAPAGFLREIVDTTSMPGKRRVTFHGDARAPWAPFMPAMQRFIVGVNKNPHAAR